MQTTVTASAGDKATFYCPPGDGLRQKVSSEAGGDFLRFYIDDQLQTSISGEVDWQKKSYALSAGSRTLKWVYIKDSSDSNGLDCGWVDGLTVGTSSLTAPPNEYGEALDCDLKFTTSGDGAWYIGSGSSSEYYYDGDAVYAEISDDEAVCLQTIVESDSAETFKFYWKVSSEEDGDYLEFYIDNQLQDSISGEVDWQQKSYSVSSGIHILKWRYIKNNEDDEGDDCGWVDFIQWTGPSPGQDPDNWKEITYKHDVQGRRIEKKLMVSSSNPVEGYSTRYVYDGHEVIAEYDGNNNMLRKYIYGPGIDQPVCMIEVADSNATYYYHFDALGSVVALSDSNGDTVQTYEYSVYGEVAVEDANHANPYMFAGRRYDIEIGLYYNRARYYNPFMGRFLQTDPIGYEDGMNMYSYCSNNPINFIDPWGEWSKDNHDLMTFEAMFKSGFSPVDAEIAAKASASADNNPLAHVPLFSSRHYLKGQEKDACKRIRELLLVAVKAERKGLHREAMWYLGRALHTVQDNYSHCAQDIDGNIDHFFGGEDPDNAAKHPDEWNDARIHSQEVVNSFRYRTSTGTRIRSGTIASARIY